MNIDVWPSLRSLLPSVAAVHICLNCSLVPSLRPANHEALGRTIFGRIRGTLT